MRRRLALLAFTLLVAAACAQSQPSHNYTLLGAIYPLSGAQAEGGREELRGVRAALDVAVTTGALKVPIQLQVVNATTPEAASAAVDELVRDYHVPAILGTYGSTLSAAASAEAEKLKTVYWETGAVADPITAQRHYVFRTVATGSALGRMAVTYTHDVLIPKTKVASPRVVIVQVGDVYGRSVGGGEKSLAQGLGINVVDVIEYDTRVYDPNAIAARIISDRPDFLWDVSYLDDGVAIWQDLLTQGVSLKGAIGTSSAFCMPAFSQRLGKGSVGVYAADKPDGDISPAALSPAGNALLAKARDAYNGVIGGSGMTIPAVAGFVGGWTLFANVLSAVSGQLTPDSIRAGALNVDVPVGGSINGGGVRFGPAGALDEGQNSRAAAVVGQWQAIGEMRIVYPPAFATGVPIGSTSAG